MIKIVGENHHCIAYKPLIKIEGKSGIVDSDNCIVLKNSQNFLHHIRKSKLKDIYLIKV